MCVNVCVCVSVSATENMRKELHDGMDVMGGDCVCASMCVCVCERERERYVD